MESKPYWKRLKEKYFIPLPKNKSFEEATEEEILKWYEKDRKQSEELIEKYGSHAWRINELANTLRNEEISESHFRELVRYQFEECFKDFLPQKEVKDRLNALKSQLKQEKQPKLTKTLNTELIKKLEIEIQILNKLL